MFKTFLRCAFLLSAFCVLPVSAQKIVELSGEVADSVTGAGMSYATVRLFPYGKKDAVSVAAADGSGKFMLKAPSAGKYKLQVSGLGLQAVERTLEIGDVASFNIGRILTSETTTMLGEATVIAAAPLVTSQIDRLSYSMADDPDAKTNNMIEMLRKVPLVTVDGQDNITINGSSSFKIYVNGKPNKMMSDNPSIVLKSFPASVVKKVEVITDPGAKYDAEGVSGILNIVTATEAETSGYTLTPSVRWSNRGWGGNLFAMMQVGKFTLSVHGGLQQQTSTPVTQENERITFADPTFHRLYSFGDGHSKGLFGFGGVDASYEITKKDLLSVSADMFVGRPKNSGDIFTQMFNAEGTEVYSYRMLTTQPQHFHGINASMDYQHQFAREEQNLTLSYRFSSNKHDSEADNVYTEIRNFPFPLNDMRTTPDGKSQEHTAQIDFTTPIAEYHTLSVGAKYIYRINRSDNEEFVRTSGTHDDYVYNVENSLLYRHRNDIAAGYAEYMLKLDKFSVRAGLRYENSHIKVTYPDGKRDAFSTNLSDFVPSLNIGYNISPTMMIRANYNMRIGRPDISYLSPYVDRSSPVSISYGDPNLKSEKVHNAEINFSNFTQKFSINLTASYSASTTGLTGYSFIGDGGIMHSTFGNFLHSKRFSLTAFVNLMIAKGTTFTFNGRADYCDLKSYRTGDQNYGFGGRFFTMLRQDLPWKLKLGLGGGYNWGYVQLQAKDPDFFFYFASLSRSFLKEDRLTVELQAFNIFNPKKTFETVSNTTTFYNRMAYTVHGMSRFGIGLSWRFGSLKAVVKKASRTIENDDVKQNSSSQQGTGQTGTGESMMSQ